MEIMKVIIYPRRKIMLAQFMTYLDLDAKGS